MADQKLRLGVNIDHVATIRNARGGLHPDPLRAAQIAIAAGADGITAHLREDRRHIRDGDMEALTGTLSVPVNFEMAVTEEMIALARQFKPHAACLVPEKREEITTEGGLDVIAGHNRVKPAVDALAGEGIRVSLFIDPDLRQLDAARSVGAPVVELHTGAYCEAFLDDPDGDSTAAELQRIIRAAAYAHELGIECHAGHGLTFDTVKPIAAIPTLAELNIGHFLMGEAIFTGLDAAVRRMRGLMNEARAEAAA